jgi:DNA-binding CsgD family transcriptional regulator
MVQLSMQDYEQILTFLQRLYVSESLRDWADCLKSSISKLVAADTTGYCAIDFSQTQFLEGTPLPNVPGACLKGLIDKHFYEDPAIVHYLETQDCRANMLSDFVTEPELHRMEGVYQNFLRPMGMEERLQLTLPHENSSTVDAVVLFRSERSFTERDRTILNLLLPHLMQARQTAQVFSQLQQENQQLHSSLNAAGSIVVSKEGRIQLMTRKAEQWLRQYFPVKHRGQSLPEHLQRWVSYQQSLFSRNGTHAKTRLPLKVEQDGRQLTARFVADPTQDQYLLLLEEQQQPKLSLEDFELLGLSKREAEVLYWVAKGKENPEIAELLYVGITTVRKHLEHIYQKLGVKTRASAVVEALKRLGMLYCE